MVSKDQVVFVLPEEIRDLVTDLSDESVCKLPVEEALDPITVELNKMLKDKNWIATPQEYRKIIVMTRLSRD